MEQIEESLTNDAQVQKKIKHPGGLRLRLIHIVSRVMRFFRTMQDHRFLSGAIVLSIGLGFMGADYLLHPETGKFQNQVVQELRSLPLPPDSAEVDFNSGYQPGKGSAERTITSGFPVKSICSFYRPVMANLGWKLVKEECYPSSEGHQLIVFSKGIVTCSINSGREDLSGTKYVLFLYWMGKPTQDDLNNR